MRSGSWILTAAVVIFSTAAVQCGSASQDVRPPESPGAEEPPEAPSPGNDEPIEVPDTGSPPRSECDGLPVGTPTEPSGWTSELMPLDYSCGEGTTDGMGNVIVLAHHDYQGHETLATVLAPDGTPLNTYRGHRFEPIGQLSGFVGVNLISYAPYWVTALSHTGTVLHQTPPRFTSHSGQAEDPTGGIVLLVDRTLTAYDATGNVRWSTPVPLSGFHRALGVDRQGHTLILADGGARFGPGTLEGLWVDHSGQASAPFLAGQKPEGISWFQLYPQVNSGLFLLARDIVSGKAVGSWIAAFASLQPPCGSPARARPVLAEGRGWATTER